MVIHWLLNPPTLRAEETLSRQILFQSHLIVENSAFGTNELIQTAPSSHLKLQSQ
jgi:hypothetical protein